MDAIFGPNLTYQYDRRGEIDNAAGGSIEVPLGADSPRLYREAFWAQWSQYGGADAHWDRIRDLYRPVLTDLPGNEQVQAKAWLLGLIDMPHYVGGWIAEAAEDDAADAVLASLPARRGVTGAEADIEANYPGGLDAYHRDERADAGRGDDMTID